MMDVLKRIDDLRIKKGWSIYMLANESNLDQTTIGAWYNKGRMPSIESLEKICDGLDITVSRFFAGDDELVSLKPEERELLDSWDALSKRQKSSMLQLIKDIPDNDM